MKTSKPFSHGIMGLGLLLILALAGCSSPLSDYTVSGGSLEGPANLRAVKYTGGVLLTWDLVPDAAGYQVYRKNNATGEEKALRGTTSSGHYQLDLVDFDNSLTPTTAEKPVSYTYKVVAVSGGSGNRAAADLEEVVFNGVSTIDVTYEAADIPERGAATPWITLDDPIVEDRSTGLKRVVLENTTPNLQYVTKFVAGEAVDGTNGSVFVYAPDSYNLNTNPFNSTKAIDIPEFGGKGTVEITASYAAGEYYPGTAVKTAVITEEILPAPESFNAWYDANTPSYVRFYWANSPLADGYSIYKIKGIFDNYYYVQGDWTLVTLKEKGLNEYGDWTAAEEVDASDAGTYIYVLVAEAGTKKSLPETHTVIVAETGLSAPQGFTITLGQNTEPYGLDDQYVLFQWNNDARVETYTVYKAVEDPYTGKPGPWTAVSLSDKNLNTEAGGISGVWTAVEKDLPKIDATYHYKLVATKGDWRAETEKQTMTTSKPVNSGLRARSRIASGSPLTVELTLYDLDSEATYKLSRAEATWAEGETDFTITKAVSVGTFNTPSTITLPAYHTGDTYTFTDPEAAALQVRKSYLYKLVKEKSATEVSAPVYAALSDGAYSKASYLNITRDNDYDGAAFTITDEGTYWGDSPALRISRAPVDGTYTLLTTVLATAFGSYNASYFFEDDRTKLDNNARYHYKFEVVLNNEVLEEKNFQDNDLDGDEYPDGRTAKGSDSSLYTPVDTPVTAFFAEGSTSYPNSSLSSASVSSVSFINNIYNRLRVQFSGSYVIHAPVTVTYTPYYYNSGIGYEPDTSKTRTYTGIVSVDKTIEFTGTIDPNAAYYEVTAGRTTGVTSDFDGSAEAGNKVHSFSAGPGSPYNSVLLSVTPNNPYVADDNDIPWNGSETITIERREAAGSTYTTVSTNAFSASAFKDHPQDTYTWTDNASNGLNNGTSYIYRITITGGYFQSNTYRKEDEYPVSPNNYGSLGSLSSASVSGNIVELDFDYGYNYEGSGITVQYKLNSGDWNTPSDVTTVELTLDSNGEASFAKPAATGTYDIRYKYRNDTSYSVSYVSSFYVAP